MAKKRFFFGTLAMVLALVFGLVLAGCSTDSDDGGNDGGGSVTKATFLGNWESGSTYTLNVAEGSLTYTSSSGGTSVFNITSWGDVPTTTSGARVTVTVTGTVASGSSFSGTTVKLSLYDGQLTLTEGFGSPSLGFRRAQ